jgi:hypothetical protein
MSALVKGVAAAESEQAKAAALKELLNRGYGQSTQIVDANVSNTDILGGRDPVDAARERRLSPRDDADTRRAAEAQPAMIGQRRAKQRNERPTLQTIEELVALMRDEGACVAARAAAAMDILAIAWRGRKPSGPTVLH